MLLFHKDISKPEDHLSEITEDIVRVVNDQVKTIMKTNRITVKKNFNLNGNPVDKTYIFTTPSIGQENDTHLNYMGKQWFWDSCFHAIILAGFDQTAAMEELFALCAPQRKDGFIPHMIYWEVTVRFLPCGQKRQG